MVMEMLSVSERKHLKWLILLKKSVTSFLSIPSFKNDPPVNLYPYF